MYSSSHLFVNFHPAYRWLPGLFSFVAVPLLFILVLSPVEPHINTQSVMFAWLTFILLGISFLTLFVLKSRNRFTIEDCLVFLLCLWLSANYFIISPVNMPVPYWETIFIAITYCSLRIILPEYRYLKSVIFIVLACMLFYEAFLGIRQAFGLSHSRHGIFPITGTFFNPGPYGGYLASLMAVSFAYLLERYNKTKNTLIQIKAKQYHARPIAEIIVYGLCGLSLVTGGMIFLSVFSRSAMVALGVSALIILLKHQPFRAYVQNILRSRKKAISIVSSILVITTVCTIVLYFAKKDSADGRMLMWEIATKTIAQHPLTGSGLGTFPAQYAKSQAAYFRENPESSYKSVAGVSEYAFNEYLLTASESGIIGLTLLLALLTIAFINLIVRDSPYAYGLLVVAIFAFFSYPLSILPLKILLILYLASSANARLNGEKKDQPSRLGVAGITLFGCAVLLFIIPLYHEKTDQFKEWRQAAQISSYDWEYAAKDYASLAQWHTDNPAFLFEYGRLHHLQGNYELSNRILTAGAALSADPMFYNVIGNNYKALGKTALAEESYKRAFDILPNRIYPKFLLMNLYYETGNEGKARTMAEEISAFNVKIESSATSEIRDKARFLLEKKETTE